MTELVIVNKDELKALVKQVVREETGNQVIETDFQERMNRKEAASFIGIAYQTLTIWTKKGWIKQHGAGRKGYYLKSELMNLKQKMG